MDAKDIIYAFRYTLLHSDSGQQWFCYDGVSDFMDEELRWLRKSPWALAVCRTCMRLQM